MFNSALIDISQEINDGIFDRYNPIVEEVYDTYFSIMEMSIDGWMLNDPSDKGFMECFRDIFPPGYMTRDMSQAKSVIYDLMDVAAGFTVRYELKPIYIYVMHKLIQRWSDVIKDNHGHIPERLQIYLKEKNVSKRSEEYHRIRRWFTAENNIAEDFADTYDEDCIDEDFAETMAFMYLENELAEFKHKYLGISITDYMDLLPTDLYERVKKKYESEQEQQKDKHEVDLSREIISACIMLSDNPTQYRTMEENDINRILRDYLQSSLKHYHYSVLDQTQRGYSETGKHAGEIDLRIDKDGLPVAICECLIHRNKESLHEHVHKAVKNYNQSGCKNIYIICYSQNKDFKTSWDEVEKWTEDCDDVTGWDEDETPEFGGVRHAIGQFDYQGIEGRITYIGVNIGMMT